MPKVDVKPNGLSARIRASLNAAQNKKEQYSAKLTVDKYNGTAELPIEPGANVKIWFDDGSYDNTNGVQGGKTKVQYGVRNPGQDCEKIVAEYAAFMGDGKNSDILALNEMMSVMEKLSPWGVSVNVHFLGKDHTTLADVEKMYKQIREGTAARNE